MVYQPRALPRDRRRPLARQAWTADAWPNGADAWKGLDGDPDSRWSSGGAQRPGMWFRVELGSAVSVSGVASRSAAVRPTFRARSASRSLRTARRGGPSRWPRTGCGPASGSSATRSDTTRRAPITTSGSPRFGPGLSGSRFRPRRRPPWTLRSTGPSRSSTSSRRPTSPPAHRGPSADPHPSGGRNRRCIRRPGAARYGLTRSPGGCARRTAWHARRRDRRTRSLARRGDPLLGAETRRSGRGEEGITMPGGGRCLAP
jgi:hypothetical protein